MGIGEIYNLDAFVLEELFITPETLRPFVVGSDEQAVVVPFLPCVGVLGATVNDTVDILAGGDDRLPLLQRDECFLALPFPAAVHADNQIIALLLCAAQQIQMSDVEEVEGSGQIADNHASVVVEASGVFLVLIAMETIFVRVGMITLQYRLERFLVLRDESCVPVEKVSENLPRQGLRDGKVVLPAVKAGAFEGSGGDIQDAVFCAGCLQLDVH